MAKIQVECGSCSGTGLYRGMAEPRGVAVVCISCNGTGCADLEYKPFTARRERSDVQFVGRTQGTFILGPMGPGKDRVTYAEFLAGKLPKA